MKRASKKPRRASTRHSQSAKEKHVLRLYVTGLTPNSTRAIANAKAFCEAHLKGRYDLQVIDIYQRPKLAKGEQIIAAPTLVRKLPHPLRRLVGDLSQVERVLMGLDLRAEPELAGAAAASAGSRRDK